jgi:hypothetical protein
MLKDLHKHFGGVLSLQSPLSFDTIVLIVVGSSILGLLWAVWNYWGIKSINVEGYENYGVTRRPGVESVKEIGNKIYEVKNIFI